MALTSGPDDQALALARNKLTRNLIQIKGQSRDAKSQFFLSWQALADPPTEQPSIPGLVSSG